jgi:streptomycin 6-kinase
MPTVLKFSPDRALLTEQVEMLRVFAPSGRVPAVLAADAEAGGDGVGGDPARHRG